MAGSSKAALAGAASQDLQTGGADAVSLSHYTTAAPPGIPQSRCPRLVSWLRCCACQRGYFAASAPAPQPCPACTGGRLQPVALWDLRTDLAPPGMIRLPVVQEVVA